MLSAVYQALIKKMQLRSWTYTYNRRETPNEKKHNMSSFGQEPFNFTMEHKIGEVKIAIRSLER